MLPANAPLPTTWSFPFQPLTGSQTSALMFDCGVGFNVTATPQNAGSAAYGLAPPARPPRPAGGVKAPAATVCTAVTAVVAFASDVRLSHVAASAALARRMTAAVIAARR